MWRKGKGRFDIATWSKLKKEANDELIKKNKVLQELNNEVHEKENSLQKLKVKRGLLEDAKSHLPGRKRKYCLKPSVVSDENSDVLKIDSRIASKRRKMTLEQAEELHSGLYSSPEEKRRECLDGLWHTMVNSSEPQRLEQYMKKSHVVTKKVIPPIVNNGVKSYEKSMDNTIRSLSVLYDGGIISKRKYNTIRSRLAISTDQKTKKRSRRKFMGDCFIPKLTQYKKLISFINSVDIGELRPIPTVKRAVESDFDDAYSNNSQEVTVKGCYRPLEDLLLRMANLYLVIDKEKPFLEWFGHPKGTFFIAIEADGAPFGRDNEATAWLVSFLNVGERIASCNENMLLAGANCKEDHICINAYAKQLGKEIEDVQSNTYQVGGLTVSFAVELFPSDMKFLASISGELNNASTYFSSFANVQQSEMRKRNCTFGEENTDYVPWQYKKRESDAKSVQNFKSKLTPKQLLARTKVTEFIAKDLKSRQEFEPIIGTVIDKAFVEPLHLTNNNWQFLFMELFDIAIGRSPIPASVKQVSHLKGDCIFKKFVSVLKSEVKARRLYKHILRWFREKRGSKQFSCRFTGEETELFCKHFWSLFTVFLPGDISLDKSKVKIIALFYMAILLRDITSLLSRIHDFKQEDVLELKEKCSRYFNTASLMTSVTPSVWTLGYVAPVHAQKIFQKFHTGVGLNTMQGREAKHQRLKEYSVNCPPPSDRWHHVFRHEYMTLFWLRIHNPLHDTYRKGKRNFIPSTVTKGESCYCGAPKPEADSGHTSKCKICSSEALKEITESSKKGELSHRLKTL